MTSSLRCDCARPYSVHTSYSRSKLSRQGYGQFRHTMVLRLFLHSARCWKVSTRFQPAWRLEAELRCYGVSKVLADLIYSNRAMWKASFCFITLVPVRCAWAAHQWERTAQAILATVVYSEVYASLPRYLVPGFQSGETCRKLHQQG